MPESIQFQEISSTATDFLHELNAPDILRNQLIPPGAAIELRRQQIMKLRDNIAVLTAKRDEFQRKMEDYVRSLEDLIRSLEKSIVVEMEKMGNQAEAASGQATHVRCLRCERERVFNALQIIFARESDESLSLPTEVYVLEAGILKKGHFRCEVCGTESLVIKSC